MYSHIVHVNSDRGWDVVEYASSEFPRTSSADAIARGKLEFEYSSFSPFGLGEKRGY